MGLGVSRKVILIYGIVQGVGFRPLVFKLASKHGLDGSVNNHSGGLCVDVQGPPSQVEGFLAELAAKPPALANVTRMEWQPKIPRPIQQGFVVSESQVAPGQFTFLAADVAPCQECLKELFDPTDRRYRFPFINCTACGPRFTIATSLPYDRERTTMESFKMCPACRAEYDNPDDRRFHAEAIACPLCGPVLQLLNTKGQSLAGPDVIASATDYLRAGKILGLKGLGGFHLACDATNESVVLELRRRKQRNEKPFALMVPDVSIAESLCHVDADEAAMLLSRERPIASLRTKRPTLVARSVAPGNSCLGLMLPYTPLHHLLLREMQGLPLVMTSANRSDEPLVFRDADLLPQLGQIADAFLTHDRRISFRCDDSVVSMVGKLPILLRRSRGYAPANLTLPVRCTCPILAFGGQFKATFALGRDRDAILSHHLGDLDSPEGLDEYQRSISHYEKLFHFTPELLAYDMHPDYASTRCAHELPGNFRRVPIQHHHAHMASCMAEHGLSQPVIGVTFDGTGYGGDGTVWGGEFLVGDYRRCERAAHLRCVPMPGGERAIREPWRMAVAHLVDAGLDPARFLKCVPPQTVARVQQAMVKGVNAPLTSSCGRFFDAVAALLGLHPKTSFEGQAAIALESLASETDQGQLYAFSFANGVVDTRPVTHSIVEAIERGHAVAEIARSLHLTIAEMIAQVCEQLQREFRLSDVVLSGGVFMNRILLSETMERLTGCGLKPYSHQKVPANDGGLCLGQLAIAAAIT